MTETRGQRMEIKVTESKEQRPEVGGQNLSRVFAMIVDMTINMT